MRVGCQSDHHLDEGFALLKDAYLDSLKIPEVDVLIVAGDLAADHELVRKALLRFRQSVGCIIYVPGNHEHDHKDIHESRASLAGICQDIPGVYLLDDGFVDINGVRFIGSTLWSDCGNREKQALISQYIFKYWPILSRGQVFSPADSTFMHQQMLDYVRYQLSEARSLDLIPVVISHQAPSKKSVGARFLASEVNEAFYTDLEDFIELNEPAYWFHGHMHHNCFYKVGDVTQVICNPQGGMLRANPLFDPFFSIEIGN